MLKNELRGKSNKLVLYAFDLLYLNGYDMRKAPPFERKAAPRDVIAKSDSRQIQRPRRQREARPSSILRPLGR
jgi:ATP-dependent DNA ligase